MQVLVSITNAREARLAAANQIEWIDLKSPTNGPLGAASPDTQRKVLAEGLPGTLSLACGEIDQPFAQVQPGFHFAKLGLSGLGLAVDWRQRWRRWAEQLPSRCVPVVVSYADWSVCQGLALDQAIQFARAQNTQYVLIDTFDKMGPGLISGLARWPLFSGADPVSNPQQAIQQAVDWAQHRGIRLVWAGKLTLADAELLAHTGAEVAGFRSAICRRERAGEIDTQKLAALADRQLAWSRRKTLPTNLNPTTLSN